jgi:hypothetical protein
MSNNTSMSNDTRKMKSAHRRSGRRARPQPTSNGGRMRSGRQVDTRANAKRNYERYIELARAAVSAGDVIEGENFYQHAEHYFRAMKEHEGGHNEESGRAGNA